MNRSEAREWILNNCFTSSGKLNSWKKEETEKYLKDFEGDNYGEKVYRILHDIKGICKCKCGNKLEFRGFTNGYAVFCSRRCSGEFTKEKISKAAKKRFSDPKIKEEIIRKQKATKLKKYGSENFNNRTKAKKTCQKKYGVDNPSHRKETIDKILKTKREKSPIEGYIVTHLNPEVIICLNNKQWLEDSVDEVGVIILSEMLGCSIQTIYDRMNEYNIKIERKVRKSRRELTKEERNKVREIVLKYNIDKIKREYGEELYELYLDDEFMTYAFNINYYMHDLVNYFCGAFSNNVLRRRLKEIGLKYSTNDLNVDRGKRLKEKLLKDRIGVENYNKLNSKEWFIEKYKKNNEHEMAKELGVHEATIWKYLHKYNIPLKYNIHSSNAEKEVLKYVQSIYDGEVQSNTKQVITNPLTNTKIELDIYVPDKNFAIEFDGIYYHSFNTLETTEERNYHKMKTDSCNSKGIYLFHIFENEWYEKKDIIKSMIMNKLGVTEYTIGARQTEVRELNKDDAEEFFNNNHLQGWSKAQTIIYGLYYKNDLVSCMSFSKPRFNKNYDWELMRYANKKGYMIHGGASKLLSSFRKEYKGSIISYSDNRYSTGNLYDKLGFEYVNDIPVRYYYVRGMELFNRMHFQKKKLDKVLDNFDPNITEAENMFNNGYRRIWDCGKKVWVLE